MKFTVVIQLMTSKQSTFPPFTFLNESWTRSPPGCRVAYYMSWEELEAEYTEMYNREVVR